ncbi:unnamed protein product [Didymodactylos carnosus]|uniref:Uncharacterized protein n=1 Tax=Didymodactylos carnosus TaxID=1234261 RepID=A0A815UZW7_9BILA|nr:unnamed protein product [Didymodactylos carnosus]CAF4383273.1 unnamed protein product [Didymodactylos carnosus]
MRWPKGATYGTIIIGGNGAGREANQLSWPIGMSFDRYNNLYVRSIRLIENTIHAPTTKISKCLNHIIRPIFNDKCDTTTIIDGAFLIKGLNKSIRKRLFKPSTLFCTCGIGNLYTMSPQEESLDILVGFLSAYKYMKVKGIDLDTIGELASIVRQENIFVYGKRMYKQIISGAMGSSFTLTLANTFMWKWQKEFIRPDTIMVFYQH